MDCLITKLTDQSGGISRNGTGHATSDFENSTYYIMNLTHYHTPYPDDISIPSDLILEESWDADAVSELIRSKSDHGESPAFLFLGRREAALLKAHLAASFGEESVVTLKGTYYMGLDVITLDCESFLSTCGRKMSRILQDPMSRRPAWRDNETETLWRFRI